MADVIDDECDWCVYLDVRSYGEFSRSLEVDVQMVIAACSSGSNGHTRSVDLSDTVWCTSKDAHLPVCVCAVLPSSGSCERRFCVVIMLSMAKETLPALLELLRRCHDGLMVLYFTRSIASVCKYEGTRGGASYCNVKYLSSRGICEVETGLWE